MANTIRIKRSASTNTPASLLQGELANSEVGSPNGINEFFVGTAGPTVFKLIRNLNGAPAEPTAGLAAATPVTGDYMVFEDITDSQGKRVLFSATPLSIFNNDLTMVTSVTAGVGLANSGTAAAPILDFDFSELTDMTGNISGTTEFILQDGTTESRKAASEIQLSFLNNDSGWTSDLQRIHADYAFDSSTVAADPGSGNIRFNSATPASVTAIYIDDLENNGNDYGWILASLATNDILVIKSHTDPADYLICELSTTPTDNTGYWTLPVTVLSSGSLPTASDLLQIDVQWFSQAAAGGEVNQTITTGLGIDGTDAGSTGNITISLATTELTNTAPVAADQLVFNDGTDELPKKQAFSSIEVGLFANATTEYVSENDTIVVAEWNWVIDDDTFATASNTTLPTSESVKAYVDGIVSSAMNYKGGYDANTNTPALDTGSPSITIGDTYTVTAAGSFFTEAVEVGDVLIAEVTSSDAAALSDWTIVQNNIGAASETAAGYIEIATQAEVDAASSTVLAVVPNYLHNTTFDGGTF